MATTIPSFEDILTAAQRLEGYARRTPLIESNAASVQSKARAFLKVETLQHTGSFKFRGAFNLISQLSEQEKSNGVVAYSSGNHAQAVAMVAGLHNIEATIVMPSDAPAIKIETTERFGAKTVLYDRRTEVREEIASLIVDDSGAALVPPYDHPHTIAGQGTVGLEIVDQLAECDCIPDVVLVPCSGGGLVAGVAMAIRNKFPKTKVYAVEPNGFDDTARSLANNKRQMIEKDSDSICDALLVPIPGKITFEINKRELGGGLVVTDDAVLAAMAFAFRHEKLILEPGGAIALAALLDPSNEFSGLNAVVVLSGGNVDSAIFKTAIDLIDR
ncbi:MAG: pyridoxal-5'-phosphate-dependent protein [Rhodospirillaceae bacterium]|nr:pyridoxal-5'-phosphate-dependent protein [Rhodospirillaceae bacterium]